VLAYEAIDEYYLYARKEALWSFFIVSLVTIIAVAVSRSNTCPCVSTASTAVSLLEKVVGKPVDTTAVSVVDGSLIDYPVIFTGMLDRHRLLKINPAVDRETCHGQQLTLPTRGSSSTATISLAAQ